MTLTLIQRGTIVDPANRDRRYVGDLWFEDGRIIAPPVDRRAGQTLNADGRIVMAGGVDMHSHFLGPKVNAARQLIARTRFAPSDFRDRVSGPFVPDLWMTGLRYAGLGYTTAIDAAIPCSSVGRAEQEIQRLPIIDAACLVLVGNHPEFLNAVTTGNSAAVEAHVRSAVAPRHVAGIKLVSPGAARDWKRGFRDPVNDIDQRLGSVNTTPRAIIQALARAADAAGLPHPLHLHCNNLGMPGNWQTTLATMQALGDCRGHLAHVQFHSYRGADDEASFGSAVQPLADWLNRHPNLSADIGQVMFGSTMSMTADSPLGYYLQQISGQPWISHDVTHEGGCGISPIRYRRRDRIHALQWAIGLEWMLSVENPWQIALSTDHPNGASFLAYPQIMALLMDADWRRQQIARANGSLLEHSRLNDMDRQYSLEEIAIITRAAPARLLGLHDKGHLGPGARADIVIYDPGADVRQMFEFPRLVIKSGQIVVDDGQLREPLPQPAARETGGPGS